MATFFGKACCSSKRTWLPAGRWTERLGEEVEERLEKAVEKEHEEADNPDELLGLLKAEIRAEAGEIVTEPVETGEWA